MCNSEGKIWVPIHEPGWLLMAPPDSPRPLPPPLDLTPPDRVGLRSFQVNEFAPLRFYRKDCLGHTVFLRSCLTSLELKMISYAFLLDGNLVSGCKIP